MGEGTNKNAKISREPQVGIFYFVPSKVNTLSSGKIEYLSVNKSGVKPNGLGLFMSNYLHIDYWEELMEKYPEYKNLSFSYLPRGRVIYSEKEERYYIITDKCLDKKAIINKIAAAFNIAKEEFAVEYEPIHYECYRCNKDLEPEDYYIG